MAQAHYFNPGPNVAFVGGVMVPAGQGRMVDAMFVPTDEAATAAPADTAPPAEDPELQRLRALVGKPMRELVPLLVAEGDDALARLEALEREADTPRVGLLTKLGELRLQRAQAASGTTPT